MTNGKKSWAAIIGELEGMLIQQMKSFEEEKYEEIGQMCHKMGEVLKGMTPDVGTASEKEKKRLLKVMEAHQLLERRVQERIKSVSSELVKVSAGKKMLKAYKNGNFGCAG